jgi:hypothetical protein
MAAELLIKTSIAITQIKSRQKLYPQMKKRTDDLCDGLIADDSSIQ